MSAKMRVTTIAVITIEIPVECNFADVEKMTVEQVRKYALEDARERLARGVSTVPAFIHEDGLKPSPTTLVRMVDIQMRHVLAEESKR